MKKFLSIILVFTLAFAANAQVTMTQTDPAGASASVNTNADTSYHKVDLGGNTFNYKYLSVTLAGTKTSGTVLGVAYLTLRDNTERPVTIERGTNVLVGTSRDFHRTNQLIETA